MVKHKALKGQAVAADAIAKSKAKAAAKAKGDTKGGSPRRERKGEGKGKRDKKGDTNKNKELTLPSHQRTLLDLLPMLNRGLKIESLQNKKSEMASLWCKKKYSALRKSPSTSTPEFRESRIQWS